MKNSRILLICLFLTSCSIFTNHSTDPLLNQQFHLSSPRLLCQTRYTSWISWTDIVDVNVMSKPGLENNCQYHHNNCIPSMSEYKNNLSYWQSWHEKPGTQFRILGILPEGTLYHFYRIQNETCQGCIPVLYAIIDSGTFKGTPAYYKYDKTDPADKSFLESVS